MVNSLNLIHKTNKANKIKQKGNLPKQEHINLF